MTEKSGAQISQKAFNGILAAEGYFLRQVCHF